MALDREKSETTQAKGTAERTGTKISSSNVRQPLSARRNVVPTFSDSVTSFIVEVAKVVVISLAIIIPVRYFLIQPFYVKGASMEPNFYDSEYLVIDEISYRFRTPSRGDVVVIRNPRHATDFLIKRIIGLPGERLELINGEVNIYNRDYPNGMGLQEGTYLLPDVTTRGTIDVTMEEDQYFLLGDNRDSSLDSRYFGLVNRRDIIGRTWIRAWPITRLKVFSTPSYSVERVRDTVEE